MDIYREAANYTREHLDEFLDILARTVNYESFTFGDRKIKDQCGEYLYDLFSGIGFDLARLDVGDVGEHIYGHLGESEKKIFLLGHYDTVLPIGTTKERPFSRDEQNAYGPGIFDMKGGDITYYMAVRFLKEKTDALNDRELYLFLNADEESGSATSRAKIEEMAKACRACLVAEPGHFGEGYVTSERSGRSVYTLTAHGQDGHAGNHPKYASSAAIELSRQIDKLCALTREDGKLTCTAVSLHVGAEGPTAVIPGEGYAIFDCRYDSMEYEKVVAEAFRTLAPTQDNMRLEVTGGIEKPCFEINDDNRWFSDLAKTIVEEQGYEFIPTKLGGGSDGNFTSVFCPTLDGLGLNGDFLHNPKEYIIVDTIPERVALIAALIAAL